MTSSLARLLLPALLALCACAGAAQAQSLPSVTIAAADPGFSGQLGKYDPLYLRLAYRSERPFVLEVEGLARGKAVPGMSNGVYHAAPGEGETMLWIAYPPGTVLDGVRISILDGNDRRIGGFDTPAQLQWIAGPRRSAAERAGWAVRMNDAQQRLRPPVADAFSVVQLWLGAAIMATVPAYFLLQAWLAFAWTGRQRIAAMMPLVAVVPAAAWSLHALAHGSNLWPITIVLLAPCGLVYLLSLCAMRRPGPGPKAATED